MTPEADRDRRARARAARNPWFELRATNEDDAFLYQKLQLPEFGWTIHRFVDLAAVEADQRDGAIIGAAISALMLSLLLYVLQRQRAYAAAREAGARLKAEVAERTRELRDANALLQTEVDERRRTEARLRATQNELLQAGKLAALGQMSAAIAHEVNQPLAAIRTFMASAKIYLQRGDGKQVTKNLDLIDGLAERMAKITNHLKTFARKSEPGRPEPVQVGRAIEGALFLTESQIKAGGVRLTTNVEPNLLVSGYAVQLEQVLVNLIRNALDAVAEVKQPAIEIDARVAGERRAHSRRRQRAGHCAGPDRADLRSVRHHQAGRKGLGARPVDHLRHRAGLQGQRSRGATARRAAPRSWSSCRGSPPKRWRRRRPFMPDRSSGPFRRRRGVDARRRSTQWLGLAGFDLDRARQCGVRRRSAEPRTFAGALVTDLKMEGMDGLALLRQSQEIDPELPVVVITGHGDVETAVEAMRLGAYDFIEKPFAPERLLEIVRHASEKRQLVLENRRLRRAVNEQTLASRIIGNVARCRNAALRGRRTRRHRCERDPVRRDRHRQGSDRALPARFRAAPEGQLRRDQLRGRSGHDGRERVLRPRGRRLHQRREGARRQASSMPTAARCSSTRSTRCRWRCKASCCACCRSARSSGSARTGP